MSMQGGWMMMRNFAKEAPKAPLAKGTTSRVLTYARPYRGMMTAFVLVVLVSSVLVVATPLLLRSIIDDGVLRGDRGTVVRLALIVAVVAVAEMGLSLLQRWLSSRIGEGLIYDLRTQVFAHVMRQPVAFFTRTQTGSLVSRLNTDVVGAQQTFTSTLSGILSNSVAVAMIVAAMASLSWQLTVASVLLVPLFLWPARLIGQRLSVLTRESMGLNAELGSRMTERFNVAGALLVKLYGRQETEDAEYAQRARSVASIGVRMAMTRTVFMASLTLIAALGTALVFGLGGVAAVQGELSIGTLTALTALLGRLYGPLTQLSNVRVDLLTALVAFERIFEVLDLRPLITESATPIDIDPRSVAVHVDSVGFAYPGADDVSLPSLEGLTVGDREASALVLQDVDLEIPAGAMVAVVGHSGAGKSTLMALVSRLYDPSVGAVRLNGVDAREISFASLRDAVGVVTQEAHLFHDTIRANLLYARPEASEEELVEALRAAHVWHVVEGLPAGLDTIVGDRGHRLSGGEKQRLAIARLLLKGPGFIVLDEATAHLDSESEVAVQAALDQALQGRTAMVIAHRLSTVRRADAIAVLQDGRVVERGTHAQLLAAGGVYADLYRTQFADPDAVTPGAEVSSGSTPAGRATHTDHRE